MHTHFETEQAATMRGLKENVMEQLAYANIFGWNLSHSAKL